ncbi:hypothetical protein QYF36_010392 [Acer negundo]|nr:hypothetical protein QYF36_010392 [Acer negundo]
MAGNSVSVEEMASIMEPIIQKLILVLDGDFGFGFEDQENWTEQDLNAKVVHETEGKRPLVTGKLDITLRDGIGIISDISFTDKMSKVQIRAVLDIMAGNSVSVEEMASIMEYWNLLFEKL